MDREFREKWRAVAGRTEDPSALSSLPTMEEWIAHVDYVIELVGADHVAIGLDMVTGRSAVPADPTGYADLVGAVRKMTTPQNARKILGKNWMRLFDQAKAR